MPISYTIVAPAKINLTLRVLGKRGDGYHDLESLIAFADYGDVLEFSLIDGDCDRLHIGGLFAAHAPKDGQNLVLQVLERLRRMDSRLPFLQIHLLKNIPAGAGFGGGSADAAAVLRFICDTLPQYLPPDFNAISFASNNGADVPVCVFSKTSIVRGIGDRVEGLDCMARRHAILIYPQISIATKNIFSAWRGNSTAPVLDSPEKIDAAIARIDQRCNDLLAPAIAAYPPLGEFHRYLEKSGWVYGQSGSGSGVFILADNTPQQSRIKCNIETDYPDFWVQPVMIG